MRFRQPIVSSLWKFLVILGLLLSTVSPSRAQADPNQGPGGPILVVTSNSTFGTFYAEILRTEGLNEFSVMNIGQVTDVTLSSYDVAILAPTDLTSSQAAMFNAWVNAGGNLIAMKPDPQLSALLGITFSGPALSNAYLAVNTSSEPGNGIVGQPMQFHGSADRYTLSGASTIATLYTNATTSTSNPAVTLRSVGANGGHAAAFAFDLATSIVYTRQGNPDWEAQERDGQVPIRSNDKFFGNAAGDPQPDWVDLTNVVTIPQADEQQRLLANLIIRMNLERKPLPRFWYLPRGLKAAVVMTGDDHGNGGTAGRFDSYIAASPAGCDVDNWECIRATSYMFTQPGHVSDAQAASYTAQGFEVGLHINTNCADYTGSSLETNYVEQIANFTATYPSIPAPRTQRHHCIVWSDWATGAWTQLAHGMRLDTTYYYWPFNWVQNRPGHFTGSAMPMRFADLNGTIIDVYQAASQMTDESGQAFPATSDALLGAAVGPQGYFGVYTVNAHTDDVNSPVSDSVLSSALSRGVPIVSSVQMLTWLDGRNSSSFGGLSWNGSALGFNIAKGAGANGLRAMLPSSSGVGSLTSISGPNGPVTYSLETVKGISYATFDAAAGAYTASYASASLPPTVTSTSPSNGTGGIAQTTTITASFSETLDASTVNASSFVLRDPANTPIPASVTYSAATGTAVLTPNDPLAPATTYTATVTTAITSLAGQALAANYSWNFTTVLPPTCPCSAWSTSVTPGTVSVDDPSAVEVGVKFRVSFDGFISGIRFYKGSLNTGVHQGNLWTSSGQLLATATFANETAEGWQQVNFATPVAVSANVVYVASYHTNTGYYAADDGYFASTGVDNSPVHILQNGVSGPNGLYSYSETSTFPTGSFQSANYWVDVVFSTTAGSGPLGVTGVFPVTGASDVATNTSVTASFSNAIDANTVNGSTFQLRDSNNVLVPATYSVAGNTATLTPTSALANSTTYTATVNTGVKDTNGDALSAIFTWSFNTIAVAPNCPCSAWSNSMQPVNPSIDDPSAVELGVRFKVDLNGYISGIRFYKGSGNTGAHVGNLWSNTGQLLATENFTSESATGWQQVDFPAPVAVVANTVYVASYHTSVGNYAVDPGFFASSGADNPPVHLLRDGESGANGLYAYGAISEFPTNSFQSSNYWVDVVFTTSVSTGPLGVTSTTPASDATNVDVTTNVSANFNSTIDPSTITSASFQLRNASNVLIPATFSVSGYTATLIPNQPLTGSSAFTVTLTTAVKSSTGNALPANYTWSFTTAAPPCTGICTIWPGTAIPATLDAGPDDPVELGVKFTSDIAGAITGIRFYKASGNIGTHVGNLWSSSGELLASATFLSESASGWQEVEFSAPVFIAANTVYVASYSTSFGHYSADANYFANNGVDTPPLHALPNGVSQSNGLFAYGSGSSFPTLGFDATNYWVDVMFTTRTLTSISVTPTNPTIQSGATQQFAATGTYSDGSTQNLTSQVVWGTSNPAVATINSSGLATATSAGTTAISASKSGIVGSTNLVSIVPVAITTTSLNSGGVGVAYSATLAASGGITPYTWSIISGSLPGGLVLNAGSGTISGTPTAVGTFNFTVRVADSATPTGTATKALNIIVGQPISNTGYRPPSAHAAVTSSAGDNNGFQSGPTNAYASDGAFATDSSSGNSTSTSCTSTGKDKHNFYNYNLGVPTGAPVNGIEVRLDARVSFFLLTAPKMCVQLSWNGGSSWTDTQSTSTLSTSTSTYILGGATDTWGRTWTASELSNSNFRVRVINVASSTSLTFSLDWAAVRVTYGDGTRPVVSAFTIPSTSSSLTVPITTFTATDNVAVVGYVVTESSTAPLASANGWSPTAPTSYTFTTTGNKTLYAWAKDAAGNVSTSRNDSVTVTQAGDTIAPTVSAFAVPSTSSTLTVPITSFTATDNVGVTGYLVTETSPTPSATAIGWNAAAPSSYTFATAGNKTLYAWAKDAANNVSASVSRTVVVTVSASGPESAGWFTGDIHVHRSCGGSPEAIASLYDKMQPNNLAVISLLADSGNGEVQTAPTDLPLVTGQDASISTPGRIVHWDVEWHWDPTYFQYPHQVLGGHIVALGLTHAEQTFDEYTYPVLNNTRQQGGIAGFAHMQYLGGAIPQDLTCCTPIEYPVEVALGAADFISEDVDDSGSGISMNPDGFINAYYRLLNTGFRPGFAAGTDYPCNDSRPLGALLTYVQVAGGQMTYRNWLDGIKRGRTVVSRNGHKEFLALTVNGTATPGDEIQLASAGNVAVSVRWTATESITGPIELVSNGVVVASTQATVTAGTPFNWNVSVNFPKSGWVVARRMGPDGHEVHTAAVFVIVNGAPIRASVSDAQFYVAWMDNLIAKTSPGGPWNQYFTNNLSQAQARYQAAKAIFQQIALESGSGTPPTGQTGSIFTNQVPVVFENDAPYELGTKFYSDLPGQITQVRLYTNAQEGGTHTVRIWNANGATVSAGPYSWNITAGTEGWKTFTLPAPLAITANTDYIVAISNSTDQYYAATPQGFAEPIVNGNLHTYVGSGVYSTTSGGLPISSWQNANYFRDVVFVPQ